MHTHAKLSHNTFRFWLCAGHTVLYHFPFLSFFISQNAYHGPLSLFHNPLMSSNPSCWLRAVFLNFFSLLLPQPFLDILFPNDRISCTFDNIDMLYLLFSCSVVSNSLWPHGLQHVRPSCPSPTPRACSNSCPLSRWCHPTISSSVDPFSSCLQSFPASGSFPMSQFFLSWPKHCSFSFNISPSNEYSGLISFRTNWLDLLAVQGTLKNLLQHHSSRHQFFGTQPFLLSSSQIHTWLLEKP